MKGKPRAHLKVFFSLLHMRMKMKHNWDEVVDKQQVHSNNYCLSSIYVIYTPINDDDAWEFFSWLKTRLHFQLSFPHVHVWNVSKSEKFIASNKEWMKFIDTIEIIKWNYRRFVDSERRERKSFCGDWNHDIILIIFNLMRISMAILQCNLRKIIISWDHKQH